MAQDYIWYLKDIKDIPKNGCKVFTTFSCGGGSSMGYKLAGYEVLGNCEIDPKINDMYVKNHHPKYNFMMGVQDFYKEENLPNIPEELYGIDVLDGSPPCFMAGTKVKTDVGYKNIEDISVGDMVWTHNGKYQKVYNTMSKESEDCYSVKVQGALPIFVTGNHPFYVRRMVRSGHIQQRYFGEPEWKSVNELSIVRTKCGTIKEQDYVGIPINTKEELFVWDGVEYEHNIYGKKTEVKKKNNLNVNDGALWYLAGRYVGDGWRRHDRKCVVICCDKHEKNELVDIFADAGIHALFTEENTTVRATAQNVELFEFLGMFGDGAANKSIPDKVLDLPKRLLKSFIDGYLSADGYLDRGNKYRCSSVSYDLILGLQMAVAKVYGQPSTITVKDNSNSPIHGRKVNTHIAYDIGFFKDNRKQQHFIVEDGYLWVPFRSKKKLDGCETVYNMSVEEDESYTVFNYAVHNCSTFSMAGGREKYWGKEKHFREGQAKQVLDDLFFEFIKVAELLKPKVIVAENVRGLIGGNAKGYVNMIFKRLDEIGYDTQLFLLNAATMGVPQKRERVFFIARRKDLKLPKIKLEFHEKPIVYGEFASDEYRPLNKDSKAYARWLRRSPEDDSLGDTVLRTEGGKVSGFTVAYIKKERVCPTLTASSDKFIRFDVPGYVCDRDLVTCQSFPQDYDFNGNDPGYVCGMSVPPLMMRGVAREVYNQLLSKL